MHKKAWRPAFNTDDIGFEVFQHVTKLALKSGEKNWEWQRACISFGHFEIFQNDQRDCTKLGLKSGRQSINGILKKNRWEWQTDCIGFEDGADFTEELCIIQILSSFYLFLLCKQSILHFQAICSKIGLNPQIDFVARCNCL